MTVLKDVPKTVIGVVDMINEKQMNQLLGMLYFGRNEEGIDIGFIKENFKEIVEQLYPSARVMLMKILDDREFVADKIINLKDLEINKRNEMLGEMFKAYNLTEDERVELFANYLSVHKHELTSLDRCRLIFSECATRKDSKEEYSFDFQEFNRIVNHPFVKLDKT